MSAQTAKFGKGASGRLVPARPLTQRTKGAIRSCLAPPGLHCGPDWSYGSYLTRLTLGDLVVPSMTMKVVPKALRSILTFRSVP